jgi:hypothetical protein
MDLMDWMGLMDPPSYLLTFLTSLYLCAREKSVKISQISPISGLLRVKPDDAQFYQCRNQQNIG